MTKRQKRVPKAANRPAGNLWRESAWAGLKSGDLVEVADTRLRSAKWEFVAHVRNVVTGAEWVEVVGGKPGDRKLRSFHPERVFAPIKTGRRHGPRSSLADAPRLPLA
ncbi:MAG: DUF7246 family protein [Nitrososphaerales archaeon]